MLHRFKATLAVLCLLVLATPASAYVVNTSVGQYDVTTIIGTYNDNSVLLQNQRWWGEDSLAKEFAVLLGSTHTFPGISAVSFVYEEFGSLQVLARQPFTNDSTLHPRTGRRTYAVASAVSLPEPGTLGLVLAGLAGVTLIRKRKLR